MIVCLCNAVSDRQIKELVQEGASVKDVINTCQAGTCCGACAIEVRKIVQDEKRQTQKKTRDA